MAYTGASLSVCNRSRPLFSSRRKASLKVLAAPKDTTRHGCKSSILPSKLFYLRIGREYGLFPSYSGTANANSWSSMSTGNYSEFIVGVGASILALTSGGALAYSNNAKENSLAISHIDQQDEWNSRAKIRPSNLRRRNAGQVTCHQTGTSNNSLLAMSAVAAVDASYQTSTSLETIAVKPLAEGPRNYEVSVRALKGNRITMEDEYIVNDGGCFVAVFDGHGGSGVSRYLRETLHDRVKYFLGELKEDTEDSKEDDEKVKETKRFLKFLRRQTPGPTIDKKIAALQSAFRSIDREVMMNDKFHYQGSTAVTVVVHEAEDGPKILLAANIGDSRAVLSRKQSAVNLTRDHKPHLIAEKARIEAMGEKVEWDGYVYRVRDLALSRAIGDRHAKPAVSGEVEINQCLLKDGDEFVVVASDGLWDVMTSQEAVDFVHSKLNSENDPEKSNDKAWNRRHMSRFLAKEAMDRGTGDNVCVLILWLDEEVQVAD
eukprot:CAMPEP_0172414894 /NCGR_PEP_ID=MMETSP1064-20121228/1496_1 /TAXON_ID=202472 /ORGANISM="Aulacoseira subarctica , Strain CCAP 1002/5" /LENGTH=487 /DNA_ID=CAMNT_0013151757 /DNA_START=81 /DNA_END=1544 /DNA_ORIENTATION=+